MEGKSDDLFNTQLLFKFLIDLNPFLILLFRFSGLR